MNYYVDIPFFLILVLRRLYIDTKKKKQGVATTTITATPEKNPWVVYTSILVVALSLLLGVFWCLYVYVVNPLIEEVGNITIPTSDISWKWILAIVGVVFIVWIIWYFWEVISKKIPKIIKKNVTTWAWWFVGLAIAGVILWFLWPSIGLRLYFGGSESHSASLPAKKQIYAQLDTTGNDNIMPRGVYRTFTISDKGPVANLFFIPQASGTYQYHFMKMEDTTRCWDIEAIVKNGVVTKEELISKSMPYPEALVGEVAVCVKNTDAVVVVERKEIVH